MVTPVSMSENPPNEAYTRRFAYDATPNLQYLGWAKSAQPTYTFKRSDSTITNIIVLTNVGTVTAPTHGLVPGNRIVLAGWTVDTDLNGTYIVQTAATADTLTITTASVADATYTDAGGTFTTTAPRGTAACWAVQRMVYNATPLNTDVQWAEGTSAESQVWADRTTLAYN